MGRLAPRVDNYRARLARGSYRATDDTEARSTAPDGSGDVHADTRSRNAARKLSRSMERNAAIYCGQHTALMGFLLGDATWPRPLPMGLGQAEAETIAVDWANDAQSTTFDAKERDSLPELLRLWGLAVLRDGDVAAVHDGPRIQTVEADRLVEPPIGRAKNAAGGIEKDRIGKHIAYWIADYDSLGRLNPSHAKRYAAGICTFVANRKRTSQGRGMPVQVAALDDIDRLDSLNEAEIRTAEAASLPLAFLKPGPDAISKPGAIVTEAAALVTLPQDHDVVPTDFGRPNLNVPEFTRLMMRVISMELGAPLELLLLDLGNLNYAASRSLRNLAEDALGSWRRRIFLPLLTRLWIDWCKARGIEAPAVEWQWPRLAIHDRGKEADADKQELENGSISLRRIVGPDRLKILQEQAEEDDERDRLLLARIAKVQAQCDAVNAATPTAALHWSAIIAAPGAKSAPGAYLGEAKPDAAPAAQPTQPADGAQLSARLAALETRQLPPAQDIHLHATLTAQPPAPVHVDNHVQVQPAPAGAVHVDAPAVTVQLAAAEPSPVTVVNQVQPTPVTVENNVDITVPSRTIIAEDIGDGKVRMTPQPE